jgi:hypothetical protein
VGDIGENSKILERQQIEILDKYREEILICTLKAYSSDIEP